MLRFTRHYKDTIQERSTILMSFFYRFTGEYKYAKNYQNRNWIDEVIAKIKCAVFDSQRMGPEKGRGDRSHLLDTLSACM